MRCVSFRFCFVAAATLVVLAAMAAGCSLPSVTSHSVVVAGGSRDSLRPQVAQVGNPIRWRIFKPASGARYRAILADPSGKYMWLTDYGHNALVRMAMNGTTQSYALQTASGPFVPGFFAFGRDGGIYLGGCVGTNCAVVGIMSTDRTHFTVVHTPSGDAPGVGNGFTYGPDKNVWFLEQNHVARITPSRHITEYAVPDPYVPLGPNIVVGSDNRIWFDGQTGEYDCPNSYMSACPFVGHVDPANGNLGTEWLNLGYGGYGTPVANLDGGMAAGGDGKLYVLVEQVLLGYEYQNFYADVISADGSQSAIQLDWSEFASSNTALTAGPDGNLWWGSSIDECCTLSDFNLSTRDHTFVSPNKTSGVTLATGGDGNIWAIDNESNVLVYVIKTLLVSPKTLLFPKAGGTQTLRVTYVGSPADLSARATKPGIVTLARKGSLAFAVTALKPGSTSVVIQDKEYNSFSVPVTVSTN
jgi:hypothetical protein